MSAKKCLLSIVAVFAVVFVVDFVFHGVLLKGLYNETAALWRPETEMRSKMLWMLAGQAVLAIMYVSIFYKGYEGKGVAEGLRYGLYLGTFMAAPNLGMYAVMPIPFKLAFLWIVGNYLQAIAAGVTVALLSRKEESVR